MPIQDRLRDMTQAEGPAPEAALRQLAVFRRILALDAAAAVLGPTFDRIALDRLLAVLEKHRFITSQAANGRGRRYLLDPQAAEYLDTMIDQETYQAHYTFYLALAREADPPLEIELPNLGAAFEWALGTGDVGAAYWLYHACGTLLMKPEHYDMGMEWLQQTIDALPPYADEYLLGAVQNSLGVAYQNAPTGSRRDNLRQAIAAYQHTLKYHTHDTAPHAYAVAQHNLGTAFADLAQIEDRVENLWQAIQAYEEALQYRTPDTVPLAYAATQHNLALAYREMAGIQNRKDNLLKAITATSEALRYYTPDSSPQDYAAAQNNLGNTYRALASVEHYSANLHRAIAAYTEALHFRTPHHTPLAYAATQNNLGTAYRALADYEDQAENLLRAIVAFQEARQYYLPRENPLDYAATQNNLGMAYHALAKVQDRNSNLRRAVAAYHEALVHYTPETTPLQYAKTQANLGITQEAQGDIPTAIACWKEAARSFQDMGALDQVQLMQDWILNASKR